MHNKRKYNTHLKLILPFLLYFILSCSSKSKNNTDLIKKDQLQIKLNRTLDDETYFDYRNVQFLILSLNELFPKFYMENVSLLKGIPKLDSLLISTECFQKGNYSSSVLFQKRRRRKNEYLTDSLKMSVKFSALHTNFVTGFIKNKQIVIIDANNDNDFSDDTVYEFDKDFRFSHNNDPKIIDTLPIINAKIQFNYKNKTYNIVRKIQIYPYSNYFYTQMLGKGLTKELALGMRLKDYWKGVLKHNSIIYNIGLQGMNKDKMTIMIKPDSLTYSINDDSYNKNFEYRIYDTIKLSNTFYKIDSISEDISKLFLNELTLNNEFYSHRIGTKIANFELLNLKGDSFKISDIGNDTKKYTLLDFWGVWCKPCRELTPKLKRINQELFKDLDIIGIAYDKSLEVVRKYTTTNGMNWTHTFRNMEKREGIIKDLKITSYPTFILLDNTRKIVYRGSGAESLNEIEKIIKQHQ